MAGFFGMLGEGKVLRTIAAGAVVTCIAATALGVEVEHVAQSGGSTILSTLFPRPQASFGSGFHTNAIDFATTGSVHTQGQHEFVVLGPCGDQTDRR